MSIPNSVRLVQTSFEGIRCTNTELTLYNKIEGSEIFVEYRCCLLELVFINNWKGQFLDFRCFDTLITELLSQINEQVLLKSTNQTATQAKVFDHNSVFELSAKLLLKKSIYPFLKFGWRKFFKMHSFEFSFGFYFEKLVFKKFVIFGIRDFCCYDFVFVRDLPTAASGL